MEVEDRVALWHGVRIEFPESTLLGSATYTDLAANEISYRLRVVDDLQGAQAVSSRVTSTIATKILDEVRRFELDAFDDGWRFRASERNDLVLQVRIERQQLVLETNARAQSFPRWFHAWLLPLWLEWSGLPCLHANALQLRQQLVAVAGPSGRGKTTLSLALREQGFALHSDDLIALHLDEQYRFLGYPGPPRLHLYPDSSAFFLDGQRVDCPAVPLGSPKRLVSYSASMVTGAMPLAAVLYLDRRDDDSTTVSLSRLASADALVESLRNGVTEEMPQAIGVAPQRLQRLAAFASTVPAYRCSYPSGYGQLDQVAATIKNQLTSLLAGES